LEIGLLQQNRNYLAFSQSHNAWKIFSRDRLAVAGLVVILFLICLSVFAPFFTSATASTQNDLVKERYLPPSLEHPFGTDKFARDVFIRVVYGGRISLSIGFGVVFLSLTIGLFYGAIAGYAGGAVDSIMMRILDFFLAFPVIFLLITIMAIFRPGLWLFILILGFTGWMEPARLIRAEVLSMKERDFILAAKGFGFSRWRILLRHLIPNCLTPIIISAPLKVSEIILLESALSFIGIGVQPPMPSWGNMINDGREVLLQAWWISLIPGVFIVLAVTAFNLIGEGARKSLNRMIS
jgi:peptide/nickel transport system permease protein